MAIRALYALRMRTRMRTKAYSQPGRAWKKICAPVLVYLIRADEGNILFEAGCDPDIIQDAKKASGNAAESLSGSVVG